MHCYVYKSLRRAETYVYLAERDAFHKLPAALREPLGRLQFVLEIELTAQRKLARENPEVVRGNLLTHGVHVQFPPKDSITELLATPDAGD
ncbi:YcgL domain-containing protein [Pseudomarimonas arenosa]|uniref:YcgL domain-containing protein IFO71_08655 n=1 Tax=Pseudomarimonas arenosa TaxID=2774145 RepID=A0AAW3ZJX2_9GAMM|nr:YcgL domain-containing protein [Pseudomarimonas arenosa]MBD8525814.1 YcgL domain-containing protein [Pseudomarimonas arenosa]